MSTVSVYVSRRDSAPYRVLVPEEVEDRFDAWLDEHNLTYTVHLANGEHQTYEASQVLRRDRIAYDQEVGRWVTYESDLTYLEMDADLWWSGKWGAGDEKAARDQWIAGELGHDTDDDEDES